MSSKWLKSINIDVLQVWHIKVVQGQRPWQKMEAHVMISYMSVIQLEIFRIETPICLSIECVHMGWEN